MNNNKDNLKDMDADSPYPSPSNSPYSTPTISPFVEKFPLSINTDASNQYGTIDDYDEEYDDDQIEEFGRKWSIFEKLERKNYLHFYSCDYFRAFNFRCILATSMLALFILFVLTFYKTILISNDDNLPIGFDFIVVGGGPAGSVVTRSLVDAGARVLLLEAGPATQYDIGGNDIFGGPITRFDVPLLWSSITKDYLWSDLNVPQVLIAKALGGCGILNGMLYIRAIAHDIHRWGIRGWTWELLSDKYRELENYTSFGNNNIDTTLAISNYHGTQGPITTARPSYIDELGPKFVSSAVQQGIDFNSDFNQPNKREGVGYYDFNIANGKRNSAAAAMLGPILDNGNLVLELEAVVQKVILKPAADSDKRKNGPIDTKSKSGGGGISYNAIGVEYLQNGIKKMAYLKTTHIPIKDIAFFSERSVVLTAGAIMTPKLLMLSGVGPAEVLEARQITVKVNASEVGKNLQDHPSLGMQFDVDPGVSSSLPSIYSIGKIWTNYIKAVEDKDSYASYGILGSSGLSSGAFLRSIYAVDDSPDIQLTVYPTLFEPHLVDRYERSKSSNQTIDNKILITVTLLQPDARYNVVLSDQPFEKGPDIILPSGKNRYLSDNDIRRLEWGISQVRRIVSSPPLSQMIRKEVSPTNLNDEAMNAWINDNVYPSSHWTGTASLGKVVDESLKVKRVEGLRIADASVIPVITNGPIHATVVAIASLCADIIQGKKTMNP